MLPFFKTLAQATLSLLTAHIVQVDAANLQPGSPAIDQDFIPAGSAHLTLAQDRATPPHKKDEDSYGVITSAKSAIVLDTNSGATLFSKNPDAVRAIGSISKLMTALVFLDGHPDLTQPEKITWSDYVEGGKEYIRVGETLPLSSILSASLVGSDNMATMHLTGGNEQERAAFVEKMNQKAQDLGLSSTRFSDPVGLSQDNVSTARELAVLLSIALQNPIIKASVTQDSFTLTHQSGEATTIPSTDELLHTPLNAGDYHIVGGKTGYIPEAGYCLAAAVSHDSHTVITVVLGAKGKDDRFSDVANLAFWAFKTFSWE